MRSCALCCYGTGRGDGRNVIRRTTPKGFVRRTTTACAGSAPTDPGLLAATRGFFRRTADALHPRTTRHVHRVHDPLVFHLRVALHEDDLLRPPVVDALQLRRQR